MNNIVIRKHKKKKKKKVATVDAKKHSKCEGHMRLQETP